MNCKKCPLYDGYDDCGNIICDADGDCIYDKSDINPEELNVQFDASPMLKYAIKCISTEVLASTRKTADYLLGKMITPEFKDMVLEETRKSLSAYIDKEIAEFMGKKIQIGNVWDTDVREMTRSEYIAEQMEKRFAESLDAKGLKKIVDDCATTKINRFASSIKDDVNRTMNTMFTDAVKKNLSESIVQLLLNNDTYMKLQASMSNIVKTLPGEPGNTY